MQTEKHKKQTDKHKMQTNKKMDPNNATQKIEIDKKKEKNGKGLINVEHLCMPNLA